MEFGKILGEVSGNRIRIKLRTGEEFMASMMVTGTTPVPSEKWITDNKDNFLAIVEFEGNQMFPIPVLVGFYPVEGADSSVFNSFERLLTVMEKLTDQLIKAKVNTSIGPQPFLPDTIQVLNEVKQEMKKISENILPIKL